MASEVEKDYVAFEEKVKRTVYLDNLSPHVDDKHIKSAFSQYHGTLTNVRFIPNYTEPCYNAKCGLLEFENEEQAKEVIEMVSIFPFMILGMPRPVRALPAKPEMFDDHPIKPGKKVQMYWLEPEDPDFEVAQTVKNLTMKHVAQRSFLHEKQLEEEEKLSNQQAETLKSYQQKYEMINSVLSGDIAERLARHYGKHLNRY
ncbi:hypothetical protein BVRB_5g121810 [Beta vulgaris subsp. vulgaris]|nr:hypothetical protein BVRB_5g121810 [Beta vulgaris subsp. vulgaris]